MRTCRKACFMSPHSAIGKNLFHTRTLRSRFCNAGPVSKHLFNEGLEQFDLAKASYTIRIFVLSAFSVITGLCGIKYSLPFGWLVTLSMIPSVSFSLMMLSYCSSFSGSFFSFPKRLFKRNRLPALLLSRVG